MSVNVAKKSLMPAVAGALLALLVLALLFNPALIMYALIFAMGLAFAGPANWLRWTLAFLAASALIGIVFTVVLPLIPNAILSGILMCALMPLGPAFMLWLARRIRARSTERP
jgi:hypothetical protein